VIGAGSAGAAVARRLRELGHHVVVYERLPTVGGMMSVGYPAFRLPAEVVRREITFDAWGAEVHCDAPVDRHALDKIMQDHDAVVVTAGQSDAVRVDVPGADLDGVYDAVGFLTDFRLGRLPRSPNRAVVVGGGYTAHDVARTLRRMGCDVCILCRRGEEDLRVRPERRAAFLSVLRAEGIPVLFWTALTRIAGSATVSAAVCAPTQPGPVDVAGRPSAVVDPAAITTIDCDIVVAAIGERADLAFLPAELQTVNGLIAVDDHNMTSVRGLFAVGAIATGPLGHGSDVRRGSDDRRHGRSLPERHRT
jgi:NADPH-dependent glutamate synthase beta subunit-like oxidoreductase